MLRRIAKAVVLVAAAAGVAMEAHAQHFDVAVQENALDGRPSVHAFDFDVLPQFGFVVDNRVFGRNFGISGNSLLTDDPGFVSRISPTELDPAGLLPAPAGDPLHFNVLAAPSILPELGGRNLSYWDGTGSVSWSAVPDTEELSILKGPVANPDEEIIADGSATDVPGFVIGGTSGSGSLHEHIKFLLLPDGLAAPPVGPDDGVYLVLVELGYPSLAEWIPAWLLFKAFAGGGSTLDAAVADVEANFKLPLCDDGIDNDKDGLIDALDPGCASSADMSERGNDECDDGIDNDGDGRIDFDPITRADSPSFTAGVGDPGCKSAKWVAGESPQCNDGNDNDGQAGIDFDGGSAASGAGTLCTGAGTPFGCCTGAGTGCNGTPDNQCTGKPWRNNEANLGFCGLGAELVFVLIPLLGARRWRRGGDRPGSWELRRRTS